MNDEEIIASKIGRYLDEAGGDPDGAMRLMAIDLHRMGGLISTGLARVAPMDVPRFLPKPQVEALDIPHPSASAARNPSA